ncbi:hypothetical protein CP533_1587 [Ophiocordyceps camponoti-saundersi (nom. inval.)]|nr:hypothetical protein CP533_1587 [Ophiocordyceps camponoti-saundersi (nom. inval.)]
MNAPTKVVFYAAQLTLFAVRNKLPVRYYFHCAVPRFALADLSPGEVQYIVPGTEKAYKQWIRGKKGLEARIQPLDSTDGGDILWIGDVRKASKVVLYFHGGGFCIPAGVGHFELCWNAYVKTGAEAGVDVAVAMLRYSLSPDAKFPVQLRQQVAALKALLDAGVKASDIIIGGDSAGGNLTTQLLGHLLHPHPDVNTIQLSEPLAAAVAISPWLLTDTSGPTYKEYEGNDMVTASSAHRLAVSYFGTEAELEAANSHPNRWVLPLQGAAEEDDWFAEMDSLVSCFYVTAGSREVLVDDARRLVRRLEAAKCEVRYDEGDGEAHDFIYLEAHLGEVGEATKRMKAWFRTVIQP